MTPIVRPLRLAAVAVLSVLSVLLAEVRPAPGESAAYPLTRQLQMEVCFVKEDTDRAWQFRIVGNLPDGPGIFVIVYNEAAEVIHRAASPRGEHTARKPYVINVPADGKAQQYVIKLLGQQDNLNGLRLPLTDLAHEVYGGGFFSFGGSAESQRRIVAFQAPAGGAPIVFSGYKGDFRILDAAGRTIADSKDKVPVAPGGRGVQSEVTMPLTLPAGKTYWLEPYGVMYLAVKDRNLFLTFDPQRWFEPSISWSLESRPWWKGLMHE